MVTRNVCIVVTLIYAKCCIPHVVPTSLYMTQKDRTEKFMKIHTYRLAIIVGFIFSTQNVVAQTGYNQIGNTTVFNNGVTANQIGNTTVFSNGVTANKIGNTTVYSNGITANQVGDTTVFSNGVTANQVGNTTLYSNGKVCNKIGTTTVCN